MRSPYTPGFGSRPAVLVGRETLLSRGSATLAGVANSGQAAPQVMTLVGVRGVGKTVTLAELETLAGQRGFVTCRVALDRVTDNIQLLSSRLAQALAPFRTKTGPLWDGFVRRLKSLSVEVNAAIVKITSPAPPAAGGTTVARQVFGDLLADASRIAKHHGKRGLALFLDELQEAPKDQLTILCNALQDAIAASDGVPLAVFAAGLPNTPERVMDAASFAERFDYRTVGPLDQAAAERALLEPSLSLGVTWQTDAAKRVLDQAAGSPYLIQKLGDEAWLSANPDAGGTITGDDVETAIQATMESLTAGMFRGRWTKASPAEKALLAAIAYTQDDTGVARTADITALLGKTTPQISSTRKSLIDKGLVTPAGHGTLTLAMPGFDAFVLQQIDTPKPAPEATRHSRGLSRPPSTAEIPLDPPHHNHPHTQP